MKRCKYLEELKPHCPNVLCKYLEELKPHCPNVFIFYNEIVSQSAVNILCLLSFYASCWKEWPLDQFCFVVCRLQWSIYSLCCTFQPVYTFCFIFFYFCYWELSIFDMCVTFDFLLPFLGLIECIKGCYWRPFLSS